MLTRSAIVILLMLNLGVGLWWLMRPPAQAATSAASVVDGPRLRLLDEAPPAPASATQPAAPASESNVVAASPAPEAAAPPPVAAAETIAVAPQCLRFGPFADDAARDAARNRLAGLGIHGVIRDTPARPARGWKVAMPAQASREEAVALAERIKAAGYSDLYILNEGAEANSIAMCRYGSEEAARRREADLRGKGFAAQATPLGAATLQSWLDARLPAEADRASLSQIAASKPLDCGGLR